jgi:mannose/fructose-specific phosphotransferase system component IIA
LFLADVSGGSVSTVANWGLDIATVAEPGSVVEATLAALALGTVVRLYNVRKRKAQPVVG